MKIVYALVLRYLCAIGLVHAHYEAYHFPNGELQYDQETISFVIIPPPDPLPKLEMHYGAQAVPCVDVAQSGPVPITAVHQAYVPYESAKKVQHTLQSTAKRFEQYLVVHRPVSRPDPFRPSEKRQISGVQDYLKASTNNRYLPHYGRLVDEREQALKNMRKKGERIKKRSYSFDLSVCNRLQEHGVPLAIFHDVPANQLQHQAYRESTELCHSILSSQGYAYDHGLEKALVSTVMSSLAACNDGYVEVAFAVNDFTYSVLTYMGDFAKHFLLGVTERALHIVQHPVEFAQQVIQGVVLGAVTAMKTWGTVTHVIAQLELTTDGMLTGRYQNHEEFCVAYDKIFQGRFDNLLAGVNNFGAALVESSAQELGRRAGNMTVDLFGPYAVGMLLQVLLPLIGRGLARAGQAAAQVADSSIFQVPVLDGAGVGSMTLAEALGVAAEVETTCAVAAQTVGALQTEATVAGVAGALGGGPGEQLTTVPDTVLEPLVEPVLKPLYEGMTAKQAYEASFAKEPLLRNLMREVFAQRKITDDSVIKSLQKDTFKIGHIFSQHHHKSGIMKMGIDEAHILRAAMDKVYAIDAAGLLASSTKTINVNTFIGGIPAEIRLFINPTGELMSVDVWVQTSTPYAHAIHWP